MSFLSSSNNAIMVDNCQNLQNLTVTLNVTQDMVTLGNTGFSVQLNCYPQPGSVAQGQTLNWFQYIIYVGGPINNQLGWEVQYWAVGATSYAPGQLWPPGYTPNPPSTTPWLPALSNDFQVSGFGSLSSNQINAGSVMQIQLTTDSIGNVTSVTFTVTDPSGNVSTANFPFPAGAIFPIYGFQLDIVGPGGLAPCTLTSGAGTITYSISSGALALQTASTGCGGPQPGTGESSNVVYGDITPASGGASVTQTFYVTTMAMSFDLEKATFGQDEVTQSATWGSAFWMSVSGFPNAALGFNSSSDLSSSNPSPRPQITAAIEASLNPGLSASQIATIGSNLPTISYGPPPVLAIDQTLGLNFQNFLYPFTISFPNRNAFNALDAHQIAVVTLTANLTVQVPTGISSGTTTTTAVPLTVQANIELAKGEDPYLFNFNPSNPQAYPSWLSFDLRIFTVASNQSHQMFSVPNPTDPSGAVPYIRQVLTNLNNPSLITNGDTFDNALTQDEEGSAIVFFPNDESFVPSFNFAVARVRINSSVSTTIGPVRVFFRLFNAASTNSVFTEVGTNEGTYRWGSNGTPGHKIPLLGVQGGFLGFGAEYVTVPCFATERINLTAPADMKQQTDPPNAVMITTNAGGEVDTYFGCWLDVNQTTPFLIPAPPFIQTLWDGPWAGTESLNGVVATAPHQCLIAEIRFDDTPIPNGATSATSDKIAQRNIAWLGVQP